LISIKDTSIYNKPCQFRNTDYWVDDTPGFNSPPAMSSFGVHSNRASP